MSEQTFWDDIGLPREIGVPGESWNANGMSVFYQGLSFADYRYWEAIYFRTGRYDRDGGIFRDHFVTEYDQRFVSDTSEDAENRRRAFTNHGDNKSFWFRVARSFEMRDHMILVFETNRTRSFDTVDLVGKEEIRDSLSSALPEVALKGKLNLLATVVDSGYTIPQIEAVLGHPYYDWVDALPNDDALRAIDESVEGATDDIINEAVSLMMALHVRPYIFWTSETELMVAVARPGKASGPWSRAELDAQAPLIGSDKNGSLISREHGIRAWSNLYRVTYEPGYNWQDVEQDDYRLNHLIDQIPPLRRLLDSQSWTADDREMVKRLVRLGRFGYGLPIVRKPEYGNVHRLE